MKEFFGLYNKLNEKDDIKTIEYSDLPDNIQKILKKLYVHNKITNITEKEYYHITVNKFDIDKKDMILLTKESFSITSNIATESSKFDGNGVCPSEPVNVDVVLSPLRSIEG